MALTKAMESRLRARELDGDVRAGSWARARARTRHWHDDQRIRVIDGVPVVTGLAIGDWAGALPSDVLDATAVAKVWSIIAPQAGTRDERDLAENAVPPSATDYPARMWWALVSAVLGFLVVGQSLHQTGSIVWAVCIGAATVVLAAKLLRVRRLRFAAAGWIAGIGVTLAAIFILAVLAKLS